MYNTLKPLWKALERIPRRPLTLRRYIPVNIAPEHSRASRSAKTVFDGWTEFVSGRGAAMEATYLRKTKAACTTPQHPRICDR